MRKIENKISLDDQIRKLIKDKKHIILIKDDEIYSPAISDNCFLSLFINDINYKKVRFYEITNNDKIYVFDDTKIPYQTIKNGKCLDRYLLKSDNDNIYSEIEKILKNNGFVGCTHNKISGEKVKRFVGRNNTCYSNTGEAMGHYTDRGYKDFVQLDSLEEMVEWLNS